MKNEYLLAGTVTGPFSFRGEVKVRHVLDSDDVFKKLTRLFLAEGSFGDAPENGRLDVESVKPTKNGVAVKFAGIDSEEVAAKLTGKELYFKKSDINLPEGKFFIDDLIGLGVFDAGTGEKYGVLLEVTDNGAQQIFRVGREQKKDFLVPNVGQFIKKISPDEGIFVSLIEGMEDN